MAVTIIPRALAIAKAPRPRNVGAFGGILLRQFLAEFAYWGERAVDWVGRAKYRHGDLGKPARKLLVIASPTRGRSG